MNSSQQNLHFRFNLICKYWLPVIIYAACIFIASSMPVSPAPPLFMHSDKMFHLIAYAGFGFFILRALGASREKLKGLNLRTLAVLLAVVYGISDELHQYFVPGRNAEFLDLLSDGFGAYIGQLFFRLRS